MSIFNLIFPKQAILRGLRDIQQEHTSFQHRLEVLESKNDFMQSELKKLRRIKLKVDDEDEDEGSSNLDLQTIQRQLLGFPDDRKE